MLWATAGWLTRKLIKSLVVSLEQRANERWDNLQESGTASFKRVEEMEVWFRSKRRKLDK